MSRVFLRYLPILPFLYLMMGCATSTIQTDRLLSEYPDLQERHVIENVPFVVQSAGHCGPASLTMVMKSLGKDVDIEEISKQVYTPLLKGSFQTDMISASRRQGLLAIPISGIPALLTEIKANHPVIIFENLALPWIPQWHYAVVYGYDLSQQQVFMHSGPEKNKHWDMRKLERSWKLTDYWGMVVLNPGELSPSASEIDHLVAASALEDLGQTEEARASYLAILKKWPESLGALMGMGNIEAQKKNYLLALSYFQKASSLQSDSTAAQHNQAVIESVIRKYQ